MAALPLYSHVNRDTPAWASALEQYLPTPDLQVSTLTVNSNGTVNLQSDNPLVGAAIQFVDESDQPIYLRNVVLPDIESVPLKGVGLTFSDNQEADPVYAPMGAASFTVMGDNQFSEGAIAVFEPLNQQSLSITSKYVYTSNLWVSTINGAVPGATAALNPNPMFSTIRVAQSTTTDSLIARAAWISTAQISSLTSSRANIPFISTTTLTSQSLFTSSINGQVINFSTTSGGTALFSSLITNSVSSVFGDFTFNLVSTLAFNPDFGGQKFDVNLGLGNWLSGILGGAASGLFNTIIAGAALGTGIAALVNTRGSGNINSSNFEMVASQTQLQVSTLGQSTISYLRLVSSINPQQIAGRERIVSSIIQAGTTCIRSLSDPINPASPSTATSTIQSFGWWVPLPSNAPPAPETISTVSFASISSLTVSSINGQPYTPGGGGGGSFDFNAAMQNLSTIIQWSDGEYYDRAIVATTVSPQYISSGFLRFQTGNTSGGYDDANLGGLLNYRLVPGNFAGAPLQTGETTIIPSYQPLISTLSFSTMITLRNNTPAVANQQAVLEIMQTGYKGNQDAPHQTQVKDYAGLVVQDLFFSSIVGSNTTINAQGNINVGCATFAVNCNANGTGIITATQAAPSVTCNINYHNIGGVLLGYYGYGSAYVQYGFQTGINAYVACGGVGFSNGWINAYNNGAVPKSSQINNCTFDYYAGLGGLQGFSNVANGQQVQIGQAIWRPGTYLFALGVAASGSNFPCSYRYLQVIRTAPNNCSFSWSVIAESGCYWNMAVFPNSPLPNSISFYNTCGSAQPFYWSFVGLNYLEGTQ